LWSALKARSSGFQLEMAASEMQNQYLINGKSEGCVTPYDRGFAYGDGVFRTLPIKNGTPASWGRHYRKLSDDCNAIGIVCPSEDILLSDIALLFEDKGDGVIKIIITRGESARGYAVPALAQPNRAMLRSDVPSYPEKNFIEGVSLHLCRLRLAAQPLLAGIKHLNRLENVLARMEWRDPEIADGLLLDQSGNVIECTMSNIFMRHGNRLSTPDLGQCGVSGLTRERILEIAPSAGFECTIVTFNLDTLLGADEIVICNSLIGVWQVRQLDEHRWQAGTLAKQLHNLLSE
jgi:4-amino-4-deoxychorismate lyase